MNQDLGLRILGEIMDWSDDRAREEFAWLRLMARLKYDAYGDFRAGARFIESLATWLQQFDKNERETAYGFVRHTLVYIGTAELQRLVEQFYPSVVREQLVGTVATRLDLPRHRVYANAAASTEMTRLLRKTLFMGLSDGARIDIVRHSNAGVLTNEQFVLATQVDKDKWQDLLENLRDDLKDRDARFAIVYLIDDCVLTGTSFLRFNAAKEKWSGKLIRFKDSVEAAMRAMGGQMLFEDDWQLCVHHYIASSNAARDLPNREREAREATNPRSPRRRLLGSCRTARRIHLPPVTFTFGTTLPSDLPINATAGRNDKFLELTRKYYDPVIRTRHTDVGGAEHLSLGYGGCALPLILEHNTPNNSVALLWAETDGDNQKAEAVPAMRPLFRRRQRHS